MEMSRLRRRSARLVIVGASACLAAYLAISLFTAERLTRATNHRLAVDPCRLGPDVEPWSARTRDGLTLRGWRLTSKAERPLIVLVHGMWSSWLEMAALGRDLHAQGFDVLLFDLRGHGQSDPSRLSLGSREREDIRAVQEWSRDAGYRDRVGWLGYSMGGATLILEAARNPTIRAVVVDSPYGDMPELLNTQLSRHSRLPSWFNPGILACARVLYGLRTEDLVPIAAAASWGDRPMLLIHGEDDSTVPVAQARTLSKAAGAACLTTILPGVEHVQAYRHDPEGYVAMTARFFRDSLGP